MVDFLKKHQSKITSFILAAYCLPVLFQVTPDAGIDGCWQRAINLAIHNGLVFGNDFIFTYGPLGYLSTRNGQYVHSIVLLAADLFMLAGYYYFIYRRVTNNRGWFFLTLVAMLLLRNSYYAQNLFLIFILFAALNFRNNFSNNFELIFCSLSGVLLFFIKLNYGIVSFGLLFVIALLTLLKSTKTLFVFAMPGASLFIIIRLCVHIDTTNYLEYGLELIRNYDQAMYVRATNAPIDFFAAIFLMAVCLILTLVYFLKYARSGNLNLRTVLIASAAIGTCYLLYKNGFTRCDFVHNDDFFWVFPFFVIGLISLFDFGQIHVSKIPVVVVLLVSGYVLLLPDINNKKPRFPDYFNTLLPTGYITSILRKPAELNKPVFTLHDDKLKLIGNSSIDIMPFEVAILQLNHLNYDPRPIPQSYSAYSPTLDSLNAAHYSKTDRPEIIIVQNNSIDNRYKFWDESVTKAAMHLNYSYEDFISLVDNGTLDNQEMSYLLLRSKAGGQRYPKFEKISDRTLQMEDTMKLNFSDTQAIYMTADISYSFRGKIRRLLYQPPELTVSIRYDDGTENNYRAMCAQLKEPVLINKAATTNAELKNFITGDLKRNRNITGIVFHAGTEGFEQKIKASFLKFSNY